MPKPLTDTQTQYLNRAAANARDVVASLRNIAAMMYASESREIEALAYRIELCNDRSNIYIALDAPTKSGDEKFNMIGRFWRCNSRLCQSCSARNAQRCRRQLAHATKDLTIAKGEHLYFCTFTIPNPDRDLTVTRSIVNRAWTLFRKRSLVSSLIRGGVKSEEFTVTLNGFHYHLHTIFHSRYLHYQEVRRVWTECVELAFREHEVHYHCEYRDGLLNVNVRKIKTVAECAQEVCKYITKGESWLKLSPKALLECARISRWHRMFELFGSFRSSRSDADASQTIVHTKLLNDGGSEPLHRTWRHTVHRIGLTAYRIELTEAWERAKFGREHNLKRRYPDATIIDYETYLQFVPLGSAPAAKPPQRVPRSKRT